MKAGKRVVWVSALIFLFGCAKEASLEMKKGSVEEPAQAPSGMISSAHPLATEAGLDILQSGGNAFDAAVAVAAALNVVEPMSSGMGGYGTIMVYDAESRRARYLDSSGRIPTAVDSDAFRPPTPGYLENRKGAKAVSTPGNVNAWEAMSREYGRLPWARLFDFAVRLAEEGFPLDERTADSIAYAYDAFPPHAQEIYGVSGGAPAVGDLLVQSNLARTFHLIAEQGAEVFYRGEIGSAIDREMKEGGGFLSLEDLKRDRAEWWEPIGIEYRGYVVMTASPPSTAFPSLIRLGLMSQWDPAETGHNSAPYLHRFAEATKHAFWCRLAYAGDPDIAPPPLEILLSPEYWAQTTSQMDMNEASVFVPPKQRMSSGTDTTHFVAADRWGNIVCATQTLGNSFGSRILVRDAGIWMNNSLAYCTFEPKGNPMDAHAGHRKLSGDCPTLIFKDDRPWVALGTPGGHTIGQTVPQMVMNIIDFGMDIQQALTAPRISFIEPDRIVLEEGITREVEEELIRMGHHVVRGGRLGNAHGLTLVYDEKGRLKGFEGGADPRGVGLAQGY